FTVEFRRDDERRGDRVVEQPRCRSGLAHEFVSLQLALGRQHRWRGQASASGKFRLSSSINLVEISADDLERQVVIALHGEHEAQSLEIGRGELAVAGLRAGRADELPFLEKPEFRWGQVGKLGCESRQYLAD